MKFVYNKVAIVLGLSLLSGEDLKNYVDDSIVYDYQSSISTGWGWIKLNKAEAAMSCIPSYGETYCSIGVDPCDVYDCNGDPFPYPEPGYPPEPGEGNGGGDVGEPTPPNTDEFLRDVNGDKRNDCWKGLIGGTVPNLNLSSDWGWRGRDFHPAWDIATGGLNGAEARFWGDAKVLKIGSDQWNGFYIEFEIVTTKHFVKYIHLDRMPTVSVGQTYNMGDVAGIVGGTPFKADGSYTYAPHLHMAVYANQAAYIEAINKKKTAATPLEEDMIDHQYSIDPASLFMSSVCPYPSNVTGDNNSPPTMNPPRPCSTCQIP